VNFPKSVGPRSGNILVNQPGGKNNHHSISQPRNLSRNPSLNATDTAEPNSGYQNWRKVSASVRNQIRNNLTTPSNEFPRFAPKKKIFGNEVPGWNREPGDAESGCDRNSVDLVYKSIESLILTKKNVVDSPKDQKYRGDSPRGEGYHNYYNS
jgi:hypothetical protein